MRTLFLNTSPLSAGTQMIPFAGGCRECGWCFGLMLLVTFEESTLDQLAYIEFLRKSRRWISLLPVCPLLALRWRLSSSIFVSLLLFFFSIFLQEYREEKRESCGECG